MADVITEGRRTAEFLVSEANGYQSREEITILSGQNLAPGTILGQITLGTAAGDHAAGATGDSTFSAIAVDAAANAGVYSGRFTSATKATIEDPLGVTLGTLTLGSEFSAGGITVTMTAGGTPHVAGDEFSITVATGSGKYVAHDPTADDGSAVARAVLYAATDASGGDKTATGIVRAAEVNGLVLTYFDGATDGDKAVIAEQMAAVGIIVR